MANEIDGKLYIVRRALPGSDAGNGDPRLVALRRFGAAEGGAHPLIVPASRFGSPPVDGDADLLEVEVTGAPKLQWEESADRFVLSHALGIAQNPSGTPAANTLYKGLIPKAWCRFNQQTNSIYGSVNVSSITDMVTGYAKVNWDRDFANANYCVVGSSIDFGVQLLIAAFENYAVGAVDAISTTNAGAAADADSFTLEAFGDQ